jgi:hypothetical protein
LQLEAEVVVPVVTELEVVVVQVAEDTELQLVQVVKLPIQSQA